MQNAVKQVPTLETIATAYVAAKAKLDEATKLVEELRAPLLLAVPPGEARIIAGHEFRHVEGIRENFSLKAARFTVPAEVLAPFITVSTYSQLRVK